MRRSDGEVAILNRVRSPRMREILFEHQLYVEIRGQIRIIAVPPDSILLDAMASDGETIIFTQREEVKAKKGLFSSIRSALEIRKLEKTLTACILLKIKETADLR